MLANVLGQELALPDHPGYQLLVDPVLLLPELDLLGDADVLTVQRGVLYSAGGGVLT